MDSAQILLINACLYTITLLLFLNRKGISVGILIWSLFTISSWTSWLLVQQPQFHGTIHDNKMNPWALLYLYVLLFIFISPLFNLKKMNYHRISIKNGKILKMTIICVGLYQIFVFLIDLSQIGNILNSSELSDLRENVYDGTNSNVSKFPLLNRFNLIYSGLKLISVPLSFVLFFCSVVNRRLATFFLLTNILSVFNEVIVMVSRGIMVNYVLYISIILFYIRDFLSYKMKRTILFNILPIGFLMFSFFWAISVSRFGDLAYFMLYKYLGEPMVNFGGYMFEVKGQTNGHGYLLSVFYREFVTCEEKWEYIEKIVKIPIYIFYTFVGEFLVEFGRIGAFIFALIIMRMESCLIKSHNEFAFFFPLFILVYVFSYGVFIFPIQGFQGFFFILFTVIFYFLSKRNIV